jgi:hypothetical protein
MAGHVAQLTGRFPPAVVQREAFVLSLHDAFYVAAVVVALGIFTSLVRGTKEK